MFEILVILLCIALNGLLACSEMAFVAADKFVLKGLAESGSRKGKLLLGLRKRPEQVLSVIQIGITFVGAFAAAIGGAGAQESLAPWISSHFSLRPKAAELLSTLIIVIPLTYVSVVFGELVPKSIALKKPIKVATRLAYVISLLRRILFPFAWIFEWSTRKVVRLFFPKRTEEVVTEDIVSEQGREYIINLVEIEKSRLTDALIEWSLVDYVSAEDSSETVERAFITSGHTRLPVVRDGEVIGILNSKEFFAFQKTGNAAWMSLVRPPVLFQENLFLLQALKALQKRSAHMGIVVRNTELLGIITMEDIFEEIVGDIYDEDDFGSIQDILSKTRHYP